VRLTLLKEIPENADLRQQWNALVLRMDQPQVFYTYEWALAVYRAYRATLLPLLFLAHDDRDVLVGVAALATDPAGQHVSFLCATTGDYCDFLSVPEERGAFVELVLAELRKQKIDEVVLANLPADSPTASVLSDAATGQKYHCFARTGYVCAQVLLSALERRGGAKPVLPRKKMLRRFLNAMGRQAPVRLDHAQSCAAIHAILPQFMQAHVARFLATGRISNMAREERQTFLAELAKLLSESGWVALTRMMSGDNVYAWNYGFQFQGTWFWYQPTFVSDLEKFSPGFCLLAKLIEEAADNAEFKTVDLGLGAEEYKERFANRSREILYVTLKTSSVPHYREILRYRAAEFARTFPKVETAARATMQRWHRLKQHLAEGGAKATLGWAGTRLREILWLESEVFFYEWSGRSLPSAGELKLRRLDLSELATATCQYVDDQSTLGYMLRAATRLQEGGAEGFGLVDGEGKFLHFAWTTDFDKFFLSELNAKVDAPSADCVMLFDCWTPPSVRGSGHYASAVGLIAKRVLETGRRPWIFSASRNIASIRGLEEAGFKRRYSLVRRRLMGLQWINGETPSSYKTANQELPAQSEDSAA